MSKFNMFPDGWIEISNREFTTIFFRYQKEPLEFRQMFRPANQDSPRKFISGNLFTILGTKEKFQGDGLGVCIFVDNFESSFAKYGRKENWEEFERNFIKLFKGDNS